MAVKSLKELNTANAEFWRGSTQDAGFEENKHPRAGNGQFGSGGGENKSATAPVDKRTPQMKKDDLEVKIKQKEHRIKYMREHPAKIGNSVMLKKLGDEVEQHYEDLDDVLSELRTKDAGFEENKHPRADNGQFGKGSGGAKKTAPTLKKGSTLQEAHNYLHSRPLSENSRNNPYSGNQEKGSGGAKKKLSPVPGISEEGIRKANRERVLAGHPANHDPYAGMTSLQRAKVDPNTRLELHNKQDEEKRNKQGLAAMKRAEQNYAKRKDAPKPPAKYPAFKADVNPKPSDRMKRSVPGFSGKSTSKTAPPTEAPKSTSAANPQTASHAKLTSQGYKPHGKPNAEGGQFYKHPSEKGRVYVNKRGDVLADE